MSQSIYKPCRLLIIVLCSTNRMLEARDKKICAHIILHNTIISNWRQEMWQNKKHQIRSSTYICTEHVVQMRNSWQQCVCVVCIMSSLFDFLDASELYVRKTHDSDGNKNECHNVLPFLPHRVVCNRLPVEKLHSNCSAVVGVMECQLFHLIYHQCIEAVSDNTEPLQPADPVSEVTNVHEQATKDHHDNEDKNTQEIGDSKDANCCADSKCYGWWTHRDEEQIEVEQEELASLHL